MRESIAFYSAVIVLLSTALLVNAHESEAPKNRDREAKEHRTEQRDRHDESDDQKQRNEEDKSRRNAEEQKREHDAELERQHNNELREKQRQAEANAHEAARLNQRKEQVPERFSNSKIEARPEAQERYSKPQNEMHPVTQERYSKPQSASRPEAQEYYNKPQNEVRSESKEPYKRQSETRPEAQEHYSKSSNEVHPEAQERYAKPQHEVRTVTQEHYGKQLNELRPDAEERYSKVNNEVRPAAQERYNESQRGARFGAADRNNSSPLEAGVGVPERYSKPQNAGSAERSSAHYFAPQGEALPATQEPFGTSLRHSEIGGSSAQQVDQMNSVHRSDMRLPMGSSLPVRTFNQPVSPGLLIMGNPNNGSSVHLLAPGGDSLPVQAGVSQQPQSGTRPLLLPPLPAVPRVSFGQAFQPPFLPSTLNQAQKAQAQLAAQTMRQNLVIVPLNLAPTGYARLQAAQASSYFNNYVATINGQSLTINASNTYVNELPRNSWPSGYPQTSGFSRGNSFILGLLFANMNWLGQGWPGFYGPQPSEFIYPQGYFPTPWIYVTWLNKWRQYGQAGYSQEGPPPGYVMPISVEAVESLRMMSGGGALPKTVNKLYMYNAFYYPAYGRWGYKNRKGYFVWVNPQLSKTTELLGL